MLPIARQPQRQRTSSPSSVLTLAKHLTSRPSLRWLALGLIVVSTLWFIVAPLLLHDRKHFGPPHILEPILQPAYLRPPSSSETRPSYLGSNLTSPRAEAVRAAFLHAYDGYTKHAGAYDELRPISGEKVNKYSVLAKFLPDLN
jgi:mannosyl-oligosaccharide alpha-1,2-mannosidase